ncbi:MAG: hypothetical protein ACRDP6_25755 [Actinoallomurus sp.]
MSGITDLFARTALGLTVAGVLTPGAAVAATSRPLPPAIASSHWGVIYRNTIGGPNAGLRSGPYGRSAVNSGPANIPPPYGLGSLGIIVGSAAEKIAFGNETDFAGLPLRDIKVLKYWIFVGADSLAGVSLPIISIEANPRLGALTFTSLNFQADFSAPPSIPPVRAANVWQQYAASAGGSHWFATGATGTAIGCTVVNACSFNVLKSRLPNAVVSLSLGISKGRDSAFAGAVDGLQVNNTVYDFERNGVRRRAPKP